MRHEIHLMARGLRGVVALAPALVLTGWFMAGSEGIWSSVVGGGIVVLNQGLAVASTAWSRTFGKAAAATGYLGWVLRMAGVLFALSVVSSRTWVDRPALALSFCATLAVLLGAECVSYVRRSYVPAWRMAR